MASTQLNKSLGPFSIWGLGVGYVISGMYFGWNLGLPLGGSVGFLIATAVVSVFYLCFVFCYAELACSMPQAGGAFVYVERAFGANVGLVAGLVQFIEFVLATPAIAAALGAYCTLFFPQVSAATIGIAAYLMFTALNVYGVKQSARFELAITIFAVFELLLFSSITLPSFEWSNFKQDAFVNGLPGILASVPYAIWFYLGIEGIANIAEEARDPHRNIKRGFFLAMFTLVVLAALVFFAAVGVNGWKAIVFVAGSETTSDSPLPLAMAHVVGTQSVFYHLLVSIGLFGLIASFHGLTLAGSRALFELGRAGYAPKIFGTTLVDRHTPAWALLCNAALGIMALLSGQTGQLITLSVFGALALYVLSMLAFFKLRLSLPDLPRPYQAPGYPFVPLVGLLLACASLVVVGYYQFDVAVMFCILLALSYVACHTLRATNRSTHDSIRKAASID